MRAAWILLCCSGCALGDAAFGDRWEAQGTAFVRDKVARTTWTKDSALASFDAAMARCGAITEPCSSYWRLPTTREWARDALDLGGDYLNYEDDLDPTPPSPPEVLGLSPGLYWATIGASRPSSMDNPSVQSVNVSTGVEGALNRSELGLGRCVCTDVD